MPYFDNFILDSLVLFGGITLSLLIVGVFLFGWRIIYALIRGLWDKFIQSIKKTKNNE